MSAKFISSTAEEGPQGRRVMETWHVPFSDTANPRQMPLLALEDGSLPRQNQPHPFEQGLVCTGLSVDKVNNLVAVVQAEFGVPQVDGNYRNGQIVDIRYEPATQEEFVGKDANGNPINDSLGSWKVRREVPLVTVEVDRVQRDLPSRVFVENVVGRINGSRWSGYAPRTWLMLAPRSRRIQSSGLYMITYSLAHRRQTWDHVIQTVTLDVVTANTGSTAQFVLDRDQTIIRGSTVEDTAFQIYGLADFNSNPGFTI